jgi:uncharacterized protein
MPIIKSTYPGPPGYQFNAHLQTICPAIFRRVPITYERERFLLSDGDFVDLDWVDKGSRKLVIIAHGLEGSTDKQYVKGMAKIFSDNGWDALAWNCRSCSGEMNTKLRLYHHGEIGDLTEIIQHALRTKDYEKIVLVGLSMGANINMNYLGQLGKEVPDALYKCISISAPCDLHSSVQKLDAPECRFYKNRFLKKLEAKIKVKAQQYPQVIDYSLFKNIKDWRDFDVFYTTKLNGFNSPEEFYTQGSSINFIDNITIPTLLISALNDPILTPECFPIAIAESNPNFFLEVTNNGGHVGFATKGKTSPWTEERALSWVERLFA